MFGTIPPLPEFEDSDESEEEEEAADENENITASNEGESTKITTETVVDPDEPKIEEEKQGSAN